MADNTVTITLEVDGSGAVRVLNDVEGKVEQLGTTGVNASNVLSTALGVGLANAAARAGEAIVGIISNMPALISEGARIDDVTTAFNELSQAAGALGDDVLARLNEATAGTISNFELMQKANESFRAGIKPDELITLTKAARVLSEETGRDLKESMEQVTKAFESGRVQMLKNQLGVIDTKKAEEDLAKSLGITADKLSKEQQVLAARGALLDAASKSQDKFNKITADAGDIIEQIGKAFADAGNELLRYIANNKDLQAALEELAAVIKDLLPLLTDMIKFFVDLTGKIITAGRVVAQFTPGLRELHGIFKLFTGSTNDATLAVSAAKDPMFDLVSALNKMPEAAAGAEDSIKDFAGSASTATRAAKDIKAAVDEVTASMLGVHNFQRGSGTRLADSLLGGDTGAGGSNPWVDIGLQAVTSIAEGMMSGVTMHGEDWGKIAGGIGESVASELLKGTGFEAAAPLADLAIQGIFSMFGGENAGTTARKEADKFFADLFDANRLSVIINGELTQLSDLTFGDFSAEGGAFDALNSLPATVQASFAGVGAAFEELLGVGEDIGGQLAAVFANNIGGSLNNLQLLVKATGKSFDELKGAVVEAFLDGKLSAAQAQSALQGIANVAQKGIPDGIGMTVEAFENLKAAGESGGRASVDALQDLASEAKELGINTIPELMQQLAASGRFTSEELQKVFGALSAYGIDSLEELENLSNETAIAILANLDAQDFPFAEQLEKLDEIKQKIDEIPTNIERNLIFNVKVNGSRDDLDLAARGQIGLPGGPGRT